MISIKDFIGKSLVNKKVRFKCECSMPFDVTGLVTGYTIISNEIVWTLETNGKQMKIGENTSKLSISIL